MIALLAVVPLSVWDFGLDDGGLLSEGDTFQWAWNEAPEAGPGGPSWGTNPDGQYLHDADDSAVLVLPSLAGVGTPTLVVEHAFDVASGDRALVEVDDGKGWVALAPAASYPDADDGFTGSSGGWVVDAFELAGLGESLRIRFRLVADDSLADDGWYLRRLELFDGDVSPPVIRPVSTPEDNQDVGQGHDVTVTIEDSVGVTSPTLWWWTDDDPVEMPVSMAPTDGPAGASGTYRGHVPGVPADTVVHWYVTASDGTQITRYPDLDESFRVFLAEPTGLSYAGEAPRVATEVTVRWEAPQSPHPVVGYEVAQGGEPVLTTARTEVAVPLDPERLGWLSVRADYGELGLGDSSPVLPLDVELPELLSILPDTAVAGTRRWVEVHVAGAYFLEGQTEVSLGEGVAVESVRVLDTETAQLLLQVDDAAGVGPRDFDFTTPQAEVRFRDAFAVRDRSEAPRIESVTPSSIQQGSEVLLTVVASEAFGAPVAALGDDALVVTRPPEPGEAPSVLQLQVAAQRSAAVGAHVVLLDDGAQLWEVPIEVTEYRVPPTKNCQVSGGAGGLTPLWWPVAMVLLRRRREQG